ncbi:hypothetical protein GEV33_006000 [Tenebrio molitor]|uniref:Uncharacterized protein n=1 Tax=Tenebrio molitor TaxID=7067 RepID=A0A8J6HM34_TENMO|nr:hypothetical protein GEV33_006000 [Tenebrio molitor]
MQNERDDDNFEATLRHFSRNRRPTRYFIRRDCARTKFLHLVDISTWAANLMLCDISNVDAKSAICSAGCCDGMVTRGVLRDMLEQGRTKEVRSRTNLRNHEKNRCLDAELALIEPILNEISCKRDKDLCDGKTRGTSSFAGYHPLEISIAKSDMQIKKINHSRITRVPKLQIILNPAKQEIGQSEAFGRRTRDLPGVVDSRTLLFLARCTISLQCVALSGDCTVGEWSRSEDAASQEHKKIQLKYLALSRIYRLAALLLIVLSIKSMINCVESVAKLAVIKRIVHKNLSTQTLRAGTTSKASVSDIIDNRSHNNQTFTAKKTELVERNVHNANCTRKSKNLIDGRDSAAPGGAVLGRSETCFVTNIKPESVMSGSVPEGSVRNTHMEGRSQGRLFTAPLKISGVKRERYWMPRRSIHARFVAREVSGRSTRDLTREKSKSKSIKAFRFTHAPNEQFPLTLSVDREKVNNRKLLCKKSIDSCPVEPPLRTGADIFARSAAAAAAEAVADREIVSVSHRTHGSSRELRVAATCGRWRDRNRPLQFHFFEFNDVLHNDGIAIAAAILIGMACGSGRTCAATNLERNSCRRDVAAEKGASSAIPCRVFPLGGAHEKNSFGFGMRRDTVFTRYAGPKLTVRREKKKKKAPISFDELIRAETGRSRPRGHRGVLKFITEILISDTNNNEIAFPLSLVDPKKKRKPPPARSFSTRFRRDDAFPDFSGTIVCKYPATMTVNAD